MPQKRNVERSSASSRSTGSTGGYLQQRRVAGPEAASPQKAFLNKAKREITRVLTFADFGIEIAHLCRPWTSRLRFEHNDVVAWLILGYLFSHPDAKDTVDGVEKWWLKGMDIHWMRERFEAPLSTW